MKKALIAGIIGTVIEWYDFFLYAAAAGLVINTAFFPAGSPTAATLASLGTFAVGFIARPVGAMVFGHYGDRIGRKRVLTLTLVMMGLATCATGLLPTYERIGMAAPVILVLARIVQGIGVGGEYGGALLMVFEHGRHIRRRGLLGSVPSASASVGFLLASGTLAAISAVTTTDQFRTWGWRLPFIASIGLLLFGYWIRRNVQESPVFATIQHTQTPARLPLADLLRDHTRAVVVSLAQPVCIAVVYNLALVYTVAYANGLGVPTGTLLTLTVVAQVVYIPLILGWGYVSDRIGRRRTMIFGAVGSAVWAYAFFALVNTLRWQAILLGLIGVLFFLAAMYGPQAAFLANLFPPQVRYSGISFGYQLSTAVAGGLAPVTAAALYAATDSYVPMAAMVTLAAVISSLAIVASRRIAPHDEQDAAGATPNRQADSVSGQP